MRGILVRTRGRPAPRSSLPALGLHALARLRTRRLWGVRRLQGARALPRVLGLSTLLRMVGPSTLPRALEPRALPVIPGVRARPLPRSQAQTPLGLLPRVPRSLPSAPNGTFLESTWAARTRRRACSISRARGWPRMRSAPKACWPTDRTCAFRARCGRCSIRRASMGARSSAWGWPCRGRWLPRSRSRCARTSISTCARTNPCCSSCSRGRAWRC